MQLEAGMKLALSDNPQLIMQGLLACSLQKADFCLLTVKKSPAFLKVGDFSLLSLGAEEE
jgi:hypothetical protein